MSNGLTDEILKAKVEQQKQDQQQGKEEGSEGDNPKYKPLSKWQKIGYWFFGISMVGALVSNAVLFGEEFYNFSPHTISS